MSGGVDSSVAAALLLEAGHEVTGATLKLWGGASDSGCCSVADVDDARRVAQTLGIEPFFMQLVSGIQAELSAHQVTLLFTVTEDTWTNQIGALVVRSQMTSIRY